MPAARERAYTPTIRRQMHTVAPACRETGVRYATHAASATPSASADTVESPCRGRQLCAGPPVVVTVAIDLRSRSVLRRGQPTSDARDDVPRSEEHTSELQ